MKFLLAVVKIIVTIPFVLYLLWLTFANRNTAFEFGWNPLSEQSVTMSLPLLLFTGVVFGFIWGSFILWANTLPVRAESRELRKKMAALERETERLAAENAQLQKTMAQNSAQKSVIDVIGQDAAPGPMIAGR